MLGRVSKTRCMTYRQPNARCIKPCAQVMVSQSQAQSTRINIRQLRRDFPRTFPVQKQHHRCHAHLRCDAAQDSIHIRLHKRKSEGRCRNALRYDSLCFFRWE